jgi:transcriptional regulator with XRE-family HTH domain
MPNLEILMGLRLRFYRERASKKIAEVARETDISEFMLALYEQGLRRITPDDLVAICDGFNVTIEDFMKGVVE